MPYIDIRGVEKAFGATKALAGVDLSLERGEVHGLLGENGAGKSTLMKVLAGVVMPDAGAVTIDGEALALGHPTASRAAGLGIAYQELSSPTNVDIATKLCWPRLPKNRLGLVSPRRTIARAREILEEFDAGDTDPTRLIGEVDLATRQRIEIIAALARHPKLLVLDELTAALPDTAWLFRVVRRKAGEGAAVIYISHKLPEIEEICDRGTVLRSGRTVGTFERGSADDKQLVEMMIGRSFEHALPQQGRTVQTRERVVSVDSLSVGRTLVDASLHVGNGEIVGIAGLEGQGQRELMYALGDQLRVRGGKISVARGEASVSTSLVPEERKSEAIFGDMSSEFNMTLSRIRDAAVGPVIVPARERRLATQIAERVQLPLPMLSKKIVQLSGGNQQKIVFGRAIAQDPACLLLFDPTRGVDAGTKFELYEMIRGFVANGRSVLIYSTEIPELVGLCDRVYVIAGGRIVQELQGPDITETAVMSAALGWKEKA